MDKVTIRNAEFSCNIGVTQEERAEKQPIIVTIKMICDTSKAAKSEKLEDTIDYSVVHAKVKELVENKPYVLIETLAEEVASLVLNNFDTSEVSVAVKKPKAMAHRNVEYAGIKIKRSK